MLQRTLPAEFIAPCLPTKADHSEKEPHGRWRSEGCAQEQQQIGAPGRLGLCKSSLTSFGSTSCTAFALAASVVSAAAPPAPAPSVFGIIGQAAAAVGTRFSFRLSALRG